MCLAIYKRSFRLLPSQQPGIVMPHQQQKQPGRGQMYPCSSPMPPPQQQQHGKVTISHATTTTTTRERSLVFPPPQKPGPCPSHSSGPTTTTTPWESLPPKRQGRQVVQQAAFVVDDPVLIGLLHGVDVTPLANNLVWLVGGDHIPSFLGGGDQLLHAVKVEEGGASVMEGESSDFAHLLPIL